MADLRTIEDAQYDAATAWHARLEDDASEADWLAFTAWLEADPVHRIAFDAVSNAWADIDAQRVALAAALNEPKAGDAPGVISLADMRGVRPSAPPAIPVRAWVSVITALAAGILLAVFVLKPEMINPPHLQAWSTGVGEYQTVKLEDGSEVQLNTNTAVSVSFTQNARQVRLDKGEAHFDVTSNPQRPFVVSAGDRRVEVVGTSFDVLRNDGKLTVTVARGIVKVGPTINSPDSNVRLTVGDQYRGQEGLEGFEVVKVDPTAALAWRSGRLIFEDAPLYQVISELNRYFGRKLAVADAATGDLRFTGILKLDDEPTVLKRLEGLLPVTVQSRGDDLLLSRRYPD